MRHLCLTLCIFSFSISSFGDSDQMSVHYLDAYIVTASRIDQKLFDISPSSVVFSKEDIEKSNYINLSNILWQVPGNFLVPNGGIGKATSLFTRGSESNHTAILLNGRRLPTGFSGQYDLGLLGLVNIDSVEYIKGDNSSLYGGAIGGIINLRSSELINGIKKNIKVEGGSNAFVNTGYNYAYGDGNISFTIGIEQLNSDGFQQNSDFDRLSNNLYFNYKVSKRLNIDFQLYGYKAKLGVIGDSRYPPPSEEQNDTNAWLISPGLSYELSNRVKFKMMVNFNQNQLEADSVTRYDPSTYIGYTPKNNHYGLLDNTDKLFKEKIEGFESYLEFESEDQKSTSILGIMLEGRKYNAQPLDGNENQSNQFLNLTYDTRSIFYQRLHQFDDMMMLKFGARVDSYSDLFNSSETGNIEISRSLNADHDFKLFIKASYGMIPPDINSLIMFNNFDSLDFKLEKIRSREIGIKKSLGTQELGIIYYNNKIKDLADSSYDDNWNAAYSLVNTKQQGFEAYLGGSILNQFDYTFSYTYLDADIESGQYFAGAAGGRGAQLIRRPMHKFTASVIWEPYSKYNLGANYIAGWNREDSVGMRFEALKVLRLFGAYNYSEDTSLFFRIENALDETYQYTAGFPAPPKQTFIGVKLSF